MCAHWGTGGADLLDSGKAVERALVVSGSCSPVTQRQIAAAATSGFVAVAADTAPLVQGGLQAEAEIARLVAESLKVIEKGNSPLVHTAIGPDDERIGQVATKLESMGYGELDIKLKSGAIFGRVTRWRAQRFAARHR